MKKVLICLVILVLAMAVFTHWNNAPGVIISNLRNKDYSQAQELKYRIYLLGVLPVGEASFKNQKIEEYKGQKVIHLSATARSLKIFSKLFSGYASLDSYVDTQELNPVLFKQRLTVTGKPDSNKEISYDQKEGIMTVAGIKRQIPANTQDPLSLMLNLRRMDFEKVKDFQMNINTNQKNYILEAKTTQKELTINKKVYKIILGSAGIRRQDKNPYHKSNINIVLLKKEKENIPILIKVFASGFLISAKLVDINDRNN